MTKIIGAILAGGKSSRFGEPNKAFVNLAGKPLIQHVIDRLEPQVNQIIFSGDGQTTEVQWISDTLPGQRGPLVGVLSCLEHLQTTDSEWLLTSACDTPLLPNDLAENLLAKANSQDALISVAHDGKRLQPANALWHRDLYPALKSAVEDAGLQGFHQFLDIQPHAVATWANEGNHFINLNTQLDLSDAEILMHAHPSSSEL